jgi:hypothetical protein
VAGVGSCGFCGVNVSGRGARAVSPAAHCEPTEKWFEKEGEEEGGKGVPLEGAPVNRAGGGGAGGGDLVGGGYTVELCAKCLQRWRAYRVGACI